MKKAIIFSIFILFCALAKADMKEPLLKPFGVDGPLVVELNGKAKIDIPVKTELGFVTLEVMINNQGPFRFILDTGSDSSILSLELVKKLNLIATETKKKAFHTQHKKIEIETLVLNIDELKMGELTFKKIPFIASNAASDDFQLLRNLNIEGVIGENAFYNLIMVLDLPEKKITIYNSENVALDNKNSLPMVHDNYLPIVKTIVARNGGRIPYEFLVDTGYTGFIKMPECYTNTETPVGNTVKTVDAFNLPENGFLAELDGTWEVGNLKIERPMVKYEMGACTKLPKWGLIGTQFLLYHKVMIDQQHRYVTFYQ